MASRCRRAATTRCGRSSDERGRVVPPDHPGSPRRLAVMADQHDAGDTAREMREHEREARERDADERDPATGVADAGDGADTHAGDGDPAAEPAPPGNVQAGELSGGS